MLVMCCFIVRCYADHEVCFLNWMPAASLPDKLYPFHFPCVALAQRQWLNKVIQQPTTKVSLCRSFKLGFWGLCACEVVASETVCFGAHVFVRRQEVKACCYLQFLKRHAVPFHNFIGTQAEHIQYIQAQRHTQIH